MPATSLLSSETSLYRWHAEPSAEQNMAYDQQQAAAGAWVLRCYTWEQPAITYGYFQQLEPFINIEAAHRQGIGLAKRPTGGGIVLHGSDLTYAIVVPRASVVWSSAQEVFVWAGELVAGVLRNCDVPAEVVPQPLDSPPKNCGGSLGTSGFCGAHPALGDVLVAGRKLAGCAVRRCRAVWLLQGYLNLQPVTERLLACLKTPWAARLQGASTDLQSVLRYTSPPQEIGEQLADALRHL